MGCHADLQKYHCSPLDASTSRDVGGVKGLAEGALGADRKCMTSGASRGIGSIRGHGRSIRECRGALGGWLGV